MSVKKEFNQTVSAVERVLLRASPQVLLDGQECGKEHGKEQGKEQEQVQIDPHAIRASIKQLVTAYQAKAVVNQAYKDFSDSGVMQWKTFLRGANVKQDEKIGNYIERIHLNLHEMKRFDVAHLKP